MFYIPFLVTINTHYNSVNKTTVYFITYIIPEFLLCFLQNYNNIDYNYFLTFFLGFISFVNLYEVGYIWNETETIKKEINPTKRLSNKNIEYYEKHKLFIYSERLLFSIIINLFLYKFITINSFLLFNFCEILMLLIYFIYNNVRGRKTQFIYFFLCSLKYVTITTCFSENLTIDIVISGILMFPLIRTMEYKAHYGLESNINLWFRKYIIHFDVNKITDFRFYMSLFIFILCLFLYYISILNYIPAICCGYMFLYRCFLFISIKCGMKFKGYISR